MSPPAAKLAATIFCSDVLFAHARAVRQSERIHRWGRAFESVDGF